MPEGIKISGESMHAKKGKTFWIIMHIIFVLVIASTAFAGHYYYGKKASKEKADLEKRISDLEKELTAAKAKTTAETTSAAAVSTAETCASTLTADEQTTVASWKTYENTTNGYTFKYPTTGTIDESNIDRVRMTMTDSDGTSTFTVMNNEMANIGFEDSTVDSRATVTIGCVESEQTTFSPNEELVQIVNSFTADSKKYVILFSYEDLGASYGGSMTDLLSLILKTVEFN